MPVVGVVKELFDTALSGAGVIDRETQDRALALVAGDDKITPAELALINKYLQKHAGDFEEAVRFRNKFAVMAGQPKSTIAKPIGVALGAVDLRVKNKLAWDEGSLTLRDTDGDRPTSVHQRFAIPGHLQKIKDGDSVLFPLQPRKLHLIELEYQDTRRLKDLSFNYQEPGDWDTKPFRGDEWFKMLAKEKAGDIEIEREPDHNAPYINNPVMVRVEVLYPDGHVHDIGTKFLDFHVHDAYDVDSSGYAETDNISNGYEDLPPGELPEGCFLKLTPFFSNKMSWENKRKIAAELSWVQPCYVPEHTASKTITDRADFGPVPDKGFKVDKRPIAAIKVTWTDNGGTASGSVRFKTSNGEFFSDDYNVGSGETELIPCDGAVPVDGRLHIDGYDVDVQRIEVLYRD